MRTTLLLPIVTVGLLAPACLTIEPGALDDLVLEDTVADVAPPDAVVDVTPDVVPDGDAADPPDANPADVEPPAPACWYGAHPSGECVKVERLVTGVSPHVCAHFDTGELWCWGDQRWGQLGNGSAIGGEPRRVDVGAAVADFALGLGYTMVLTDQGVLWGMGLNEFRTVGLPAPVDEVTIPTIIDRPALSRVFAGWDTVCALTADSGELLCWGRPLHQPHDMDDGQPEATLIELSDVRDVTMAKNAACARVGDDADLYCWGHNTFGSVGVNNINKFYPKPTPNGLTGVQHLAGGDGHFCALLAGEDRPLCWGGNGLGQVATSAVDPVLSPTPLSFTDLPFTVVATGAGQRCSGLLLEDGRVAFMGLNSNQIAGVEGELVGPTIHPEVEGMTSLTMGWQHACGLRDDGAIVCWGNNEYGVIGTSDFGGYASPTVVRIPELQSR